MISILKPYKEGFILYDMDQRKYIKLSEEECKIVQNSLPCCNQVGKLKNKEYTFVGLQTPLKVFWDITDKCNAQCIHCFTNSGKKANGELTKNQIYSVIDQLVYYGMMNIAFSGGEPFIRSDFVDILKYASDKGALLSLTTNGSLLNIDKIKILVELNLKSITISLDGYSQTTFGKIRKGLDVNIVKDNIMILVQYAKNKDLEVNIRTTLNALNLLEIYDILKFCSNSGVDCLKINNTNLWGRAKDNPSLRLDEMEFVNSLLMVQEKAKEYNCRVELPIEKYLTTGHAQDCMHICTSTIDTINIFANGDIGACGFCEKQLIFGNIIKDGLTTILTNSLPFNFDNEVCKNCDIHKFTDVPKLTNVTPYVH